MDTQTLTSRILERVRLSIFFSDLSQRELERRIGFSRGYLSQLLGGAVELKLWQLLAILHAMELEPSEFFVELFPRRRQPALARRARQQPLSLELAQLYTFGIESMADFHERLERCEDALEELADLGILENSGKKTESRV